MKKLSLIKLITSMTVFGTIGVFVRHIDAERGFIALVRGAIGAVFLLLLLLLMRKRPSLEAIKRNLIYLILSGAAIGVNWIFLFESYSYTTIATSTLCYYMAPVFVILVSPFLLKERITPKKGVCVAVALLGMVLVSGVLEGAGEKPGGYIGVLLALGAAVFYAAVTVLNKKLSNISSYDMTIVQLSVAALTVLPYTMLAENNDFSEITPTAVILLIVVGVLHTGICYALFFSSIQELETQTVAIFSYLDPIVAIILSLALGDDMTVLMGIGSVLIIGALLSSEVDFGSLLKKK